MGLARQDDTGLELVPDLGVLVVPNSADAVLLEFVVRARTEKRQQAEPFVVRVMPSEDGKAYGDFELLISRYPFVFEKYAQEVDVR